MICLRIDDVNHFKKFREFIKQFFLESDVFQIFREQYDSIFDLKIF